MLTMLVVTFKVSFLGFGLANLYYVLFSQRSTVREKTRKFLASRTATLLAAPGLVVLVVISAEIAIKGMLVILDILRSHIPSDNIVFLVAAIWMVFSIIFGWAVDYVWTRGSRKLPTMGFNL